MNQPTLSSNSSRFALCTFVLITSLLQVRPAKAWDANGGQAQAESERADEEAAAKGVSYSLRLAPALIRYSTFGGAGAGALGVSGEAEMLNFFAAGGFGAGASLGLSQFFDTNDLQLPIKIHFAYADRHGIRVSVHGMTTPHFSTSGDGNGFMAGLGGQFAYDFDLSQSEDNWMRNDKRTWGMGAFFDLSAITPLTDESIYPKGNWLGIFSLGVVARYN